MKATLLDCFVGAADVLVLVRDGALVLLLEERMRQDWMTGAGANVPAVDVVEVLLVVIEKF